jgi:REP element-mobilizing transposase RayT
LSFYTRKLPHWQPAGAALFLTWRLDGSLPREYRTAHPDMDPGRQFVDQDRILDRATSGPTWLADPRVALLVADALRYGEASLQPYELAAWVIMPNHVHLLIDPRAPIARINHSIRGYSGREANRALGCTGAFWQHEGYDHWARNGGEFGRIAGYIERNPVTAGLAGSPEDWRWSSAFVG